MWQRAFKIGVISHCRYTSTRRVHSSEIGRFWSKTIVICDRVRWAANANRSRSRQCGCVLSPWKHALKKNRRKMWLLWRVLGLNYNILAYDVQRREEKRVILATGRWGFNTRYMALKLLNSNKKKKHQYYNWTNKNVIVRTSVRDTYSIVPNCL